MINALWLIPAVLIAATVSHFLTRRFLTWKYAPVLEKVRDEILAKDAAFAEERRKFFDEERGPLVSARIERDALLRQMKALEEWQGDKAEELSSVLYRAHELAADWRNRQHTLKRRTDGAA
jgi:hypothetical protein